MKKIKPDSISLTHRCLVFNKDNLLFVNALAAFDFDRPDDPLTEDDVWAELKEAAQGHIFDEAILKSRGEFIVSGACHAPGGAPVQGCEVLARVGSASKRLTVFGDRYWVGQGGMTQATDPAPFTRMDLTWDKAFGGKGYNRNRQGKGVGQVVRPDGQTLRPLPNVEYPDQLITGPDDRPEPACLGILGSLRFWRGKGFGTYDDKWFAEHWPFIAPDVDLDLINTASPDQWNQGYYQGGEPVEVRNMHPVHPALSTRLPRLRARAFTRREVMFKTSFDELQMHFDTAWIIPEKKRLVCVWRGMLLVSGQKARDVTHVVAELEPLDQPPLPREHYLAQIGGVPAPPPPEAAPTPPPAARPAPPSPPAEPAPAPPPLASPPPQDHAVEAMLGSIREALAKRNIAMPDFSAPPPAPVDPLGLEGLSPEEILAKTEGMLRETQAKLQGVMQGLGVDPEGFTPAATPGKQELLATLAALDIRDAKLKQMVDQLSGIVQELDDVPHARPAPPPLSEPGPPPEPPVSALTREEVLRRVAQGRSLAHEDLTGLDLSGAPLAGADLRGAILELASLKGSDLAGADLTGALLAKADLSGVQAAKAVFKGAVGRGAKAPGALFSGALLAGADFAGADFTGADFTGADLGRANLASAALDKAVFAGCRAGQARFDKARATGADFRGAGLDGAGFSGALLDGADFTQARAAGTTFDEAAGKKALFVRADLSNSQAPGGADFQGADFSEASLAGAVWTDCDLSASRFAGASLDSATLRRTRLEGADFTRATARNACLDEADLSGARLSKVNAFKASLREATLHRADLGDSNFFSADFFKAIFHETNLAGSNLGRTVLEKWRKIKL